MTRAPAARLTMVSFRADAELLEVLKVLETAVGDGVMRRRSIAIRRALIEAAERVKRRGSK